MDDFMFAGVTYQCRLRVCNKPGCRCHQGEKHGPYWYARSNKLVYIGKELPKELLVHLAVLKSKQEVVKKKVTSLQLRERELLKQLREIQHLRENLSSYSRGGAYDVSCLRAALEG